MGNLCAAKPPEPQHNSGASTQPGPTAAVARLFGAPAVVRTFVHDLIEKGIQEHKMSDGKYYITLQSKNITDLTAFRDCANKLRDL